VGNRFEVLKSQVMQYRVKEVRRQKKTEGRVRCFRCGEEEHKKWECPKVKERRKKKEAVPLREVWKKVKEHCGARELPPREAVMSMKGWMTWGEVVTYIECRGCNYKGTKTQENRGQSFLSKEQLCNMWCENCNEVWNWREREAESGRAERVKYSVYGGKDAVVGGKVERNEKGKVFYLPYRTGKKVPWWNWSGEI